MFHFLRHLRFLLPLTVVALATSSAQAGFVCVGNESHQWLDSLSPELPGAGASSQTEEKGDAPSEPACLEFLSLDQLYAGNSPAGGGMSTVSPVNSGGSSAPAAFLSQTMLPSAGPVSPLYLREIPFTPQLMIADIFRPPCA